MNPTETELNRTASTEANAADATNHVDMEVDVTGEEVVVDEDHLVDYNEQEAAAAAEKAAAKLALKEMLIKNGFALRMLLKTEQIKAHYVSPLAKEEEVSIEDIILLEIPEEDLHEVRMVQGRMFMPASFAQKWVLSAIRVRKTLKRHDKNLPGGMETAVLFSIFDQLVMDLIRPRHELDNDYAR
jgi:hypothetical protein